MIEDGISASNILLFTFTKKAANEIAERVYKQIGEKSIGITVSTYHSFCARQLRRYCSYLNYDDNFTIIDENDQKNIINKILKDMNSRIQAGEVIAAISSYKGKHLTPQQALIHYEDKLEEREYIEVYRQYQRTLRRNNVMDFDDLIFNMVTILEENENVRAQIWEKYKYVVSDESQDQGTSDTKLILLLMNPKTMNLCLIGDVDQSKVYCSAYK